MSSYVAYMGTNDFIGGDISVVSITADEATVLGNIVVGGLVDGVDIKALGNTVAGHTVELQDHENRIVVLENKELTDVVTLSTDQTITGTKTFIAGTTYFNHITSRSGYMRSGSSPNTFVTMQGGTTAFPNNPTVALVCRAAGRSSNIGFETEMSLGNDYIITESFDDKKLHFNKGQRFGAGTMMTFDGAANEIEVKADRFKISKSRGQVTAGVGTRTTNRAEMFLISNGDGVSEIFMGSDTDGTERSEGNIKWDISSRDKGNGRLMFYRGPGYTGSFDEKDVYIPAPGNYDSVMDFQNTKNTTTRRYDCVINMNKPVNMNGGLSVNGQNISVTSYKANPDRLYWLGKFINMLDYWTTCSIQKICNTVTMTIGAFTARHMVDGPTASWYIESNKNLSPIPVAFRPDVDLTFPVVIRVTMDNIGRVSRCIVKTDGSVWICGDVNDFTHFQGRLAFEAFSVSWVVGL